MVTIQYMYRDKNFPVFLKTEFFERNSVFPVLLCPKIYAGYISVKVKKIPERQSVSTNSRHRQDISFYQKEFSVAVYVRIFCHPPICLLQIFVCMP